MKVLNVTIEKFKNIDSLSIPAGGASVYLVGKNQSGKSSVIQAIWGTLTGKDLPPEPIKQGEESAVIQIELGEDTTEFTAKIRFTEGRKSGHLSLKSHDGQTFKSPRGMLESLVGNISFDPFDFLKKSATEQVKELCKALKVDIFSIEDEYKEAYAERTIINRSLKLKKGIVETAENKTPHIINAAKEGIEPIDTSVVQHELSEVYKRNAQITEIETKLEAKIEKEKALSKRWEEIVDTISKLEEELEVLKAEYAGITDQIVKGKDWLENNPKEDVSVFEESLANAAQHNRLYDEVQSYNKNKEELSALQYDADNINYKLEKLQDAKKKMLADSQLGIDGLDIKQEGIFYNELPLSSDQINTAKLIEIGIRISMSINPDLRIVKISDGSMLDKETLKEVQELLHEHDFQAFVEIVDFDGGPLEVMLEETFNDR